MADSSYNTLCTAKPVFTGVHALNRAAFEAYADGVAKVPPAAASAILA
ncbi:hypothetical protein VSX64_20120 [Aurantimonas sp. C2-6-R+9]|nr:MULTISPECIES: hypothetical protein [unclassified Aurantimonas]MEC5292937.1 hypothetical protein [Aurantimonas sp. C2-3-R2]MEC5383135.1 hypothetical protein [Aurantimonas sp. C2-6-R+9]MEC5413970.1 hypothetical protein [Aurantimonas sp. C2-4-R8]